MSFSLFIKECKAVLKSASYILFVIAVLLFYYFQIGTLVPEHIEGADSASQSEEAAEINPLIEPLPDMSFYGTKTEEIPEQIMPTLIARLADDTDKNNYATYNLGFYKGVHLNEKELDSVKKIIEYCTGKSFEEVVAAAGNDVPVICSYDEFKEKMLEVEKLIGKNSSYAYEEYRNISKVPLNYDEAKAIYNEIIENDRISGAYARLFCDYMNIVAVFFSVFVAVALIMRDKRHGVNELIFSHKMSSLKFIVTKYTACVVMLIIPFIVVSLMPSIRITVYGINNDITVNALAYIEYIICWILPSVMISVAVGFALTVLSDTHFGIFVWFAIAFISLISSTDNISNGNYKLNPVLRFNKLGGYDIFNSHIGEFAVNRIFYTALAIVLLAATVIIYDKKRSGRINVRAKIDKLLNNIKDADEAAD